MLEIGQSPASFTLRDQNDEEFAWDAQRGKPVVIFFYPKANTPGCTKEACAFRDLAPEFAKRGIVVVGASADTVKRQSNFREKYDLTMPLLADTDHEILAPWGIWGEKKNYGKTYMGIKRTTMLFDADGVLRHRWDNVRVKEHADKVLAVTDEILW